MILPFRTPLLLAAGAGLALSAVAVLRPFQAPDLVDAPSDEEHRAAFGYLLGDWEFTGQRLTPSGRQDFHGFWTATRTPDNRSLVDEYRVVDGAGATIYVTTTLRAFHPSEHRWSIEPSGEFAEGKAWKDGADMRIEQTFGGRPLRFRYHDIGPDRFSWVGSGPGQDGAYVEFQWIEARRIGPPRPGVLAVRSAAREADAKR